MNRLTHSVTIPTYSSATCKPAISLSAPRRSCRSIVPTRAVSPHRTVRSLGSDGAHWLSSCSIRSTTSATSTVPSDWDAATATVIPNRDAATLTAVDLPVQLLRSQSGWIGLEKIHQDAQGEYDFGCFGMKLWSMIVTRNHRHNT